MNIFVSKAFGAAMAILHIMAIFFVVVFVNAGSSPVTIAAGIGILILYVFLVGIGATLVAIREHLETLIKHGERNE